MNGPVIVCGVGKVGRRVLECLRGDDVAVVAVDMAPPADLPADVRAVAGDCRQAPVLIAAGVHEAAGVIVCMSDDLTSLSAVLAIRRIAPAVRIVVRTFNPNLVERLGKAVANVVPLSVSGLVAPLLALIARTGSALGSVAAADGDRPVAEVTVTGDSPLAGRSLKDVTDRVAPVAYVPADGVPHFLLDVPADAVLSPGDRLIVCGRPADLARLTGATDETLDVRWAGQVQRGWRVLRRAIAEVDWPVKFGAVTLAAVILGSTAIYALAEQVGPADAFHSVIQIMATGEKLPGDKDGPFIKIFIGCLRVAGAALIAGFTALFTNYLVRARLGGVLELRRIPDGGHVVVCGLGNVGFRVCEELLKAGQPVVAIDAANTGRFQATARRLGAAVITGDATVPLVLRQARADTARAVIAATDNDLANVEVALLARDLRPKQRVVVRLTNDALAETLRESANVQLAFSVPALSAPAFVAALYGDRVQAVFLVAGRLFAAVEIAVAAGEACLDGETVRAAAVDFGLLPVALAAAGGRAVDEPWAHRLGAGDRLTALVSLGDLDRLYRRERAALDWSVEIDSFPLTARDTLRGMLAQVARLTPEQAGARLDRLPCVVRNGLTRGQAESLAAQLRRERVTARVIGSAAAAS